MLIMKKSSIHSYDHKIFIKRSIIGTFQLTQSKFLKHFIPGLMSFPEELCVGKNG